MILRIWVVGMKCLYESNDCDKHLYTDVSMVLLQRFMAFHLWNKKSVHTFDKYACIGCKRGKLTPHAILFSGATHMDFWLLVLLFSHWNFPIVYVFQIGYLDVVIPPDFVAEDTSSDVIVPEGSSVKLTCRFVAFSLILLHLNHIKKNFNTIEMKWPWQRIPWTFSLFRFGKNFSINC